MDLSAVDLPDRPHQHAFSDEEIIRAFSGLLAPLADPLSQVLTRSDIAPHVVPGTGVWTDPDVQGDAGGPAEDYIGFGLIIKDAVDAETGDPFIVAVKVHKPSFMVQPKRYALSLIAGLSRGIGKMEAEMRLTESGEGKKILREARRRQRNLERLMRSRDRRGASLH